MSAESFLGGKAMLCCGDSIHFMRDQPENRYDSIVCDPPYALVSIVNRFSKTSENDDTKTSERVRTRSDGYARLTAGGFMGKKWDTGESAHNADFWSECLRVLKPGGYVLAFAGTRTYHRLAYAIEDAGFEIRDMISWLYGSGFPKSHDVSKGVDRAAGAEREVTRNGQTKAHELAGKFDLASSILRERRDNAATASAIEWQGWGTALKPACEPICMARKPLSEGTVAANVLRWGTGAINVDGCRVETDENLNGGAYASNGGRVPLVGDERVGAALGMFQAGKTAERGFEQPKGRWPANVIHDGSEEVVAGFPDVHSAGAARDEPGGGDKGNWGNIGIGQKGFRIGDSGSAARFFYTAKADSDDRLGSKHPTVKPVDLMQYLVRLVTPKGGLVLDPFAGTGTTAEACFREGMTCAMVEREPEYQADIRRRMALVMGGPEERRRESIKAKKLPIDHGPLFSCG